jgi:Ca2+-binding RTX toxin-like protein
MSESISVGYRQLGSFYYHKFIVYTDGNGNQWATSGWAGGEGNLGSSDASQSGSSGSGSSASDLGPIVNTGGSSDPKRYDPDYSDHPKNPDGTDKYPGREIKWETIKEGDDLSGDWKNVTDAMDDIAREGHDYRPLDQNSNSAADEALRRSGLTEPSNDGFFGDSWAPGSGNNLPGGPDDKNFWDRFKDWWDSAKNWIWPRDPIILDLNDNGLETVGLTANIHFDHDGDGVLTRTGWVGKDDALLVWDRNANGRIDTGAELFGDFTLLPNGTLAPNGFAALAALDSNGDGVIDASDPLFAELKLWRDTDQDGATGAGELISLADAGIVSLNLANALKNQRLANGNTLARAGSFTRADGSSSAMGEFHFATDTFSTKFAEQIDVPDALKSLPNMGGAGNVRELQQAAAQSGNLAGVLSQFQGATTRAEQNALLDALLSGWARSAGMGSLEQRAAGKYNIVYEAFGNQRRSSNLNSAAFSSASFSSGSVSGASASSGGSGLLSEFNGTHLSAYYRNLISDWSRKLQVLEAFNGQYFFNLPAQKSQTTGANWGLAVGTSSSGGSGNGGISLGGAVLPTLRVNFSQTQLDLLDQAYTSLKESVYASLVLQTRLKPYLDQVELVTDESGLRLDATPLNQKLADKKALDPENYLADLLDLDKYASRLLSGTNWAGLADFDTAVEALPQTAGIAALLAEFQVRRLTGDDDSASLTNNADIVLAGNGNDHVYGGNGNDRLFGQAGDDSIYGDAGDDLISGGAGNDVLYGGAGADTFVFGRGYGHDIIHDSVESSVRRDSVRLLGLTPADIRVTVDYLDNLLLTIIDTGETLSVPKNSYRWGENGVGRYVFDDGTVWSHDDALRTTVAATTEGDDLIQGSSAGDRIIGQAGNDTLIGHRGDDIIDGVAGNDLLIGSTGWNSIFENGTHRPERNTTPTISANGNDTYLFGRGDGQDTVIDGDYTVGNTDTLRFKEGVTPADIRLIRNGNDLVLAIRGTADQVTLKHYFEEHWGTYRPWLIERVAFADGTQWSSADVQAILFAGSEEAETILGSRGDDVLTGQDGDDTLVGNAGDDVLEGGGGNDLLLGGAGRDVLDGGAGNDVLRGGGMWGNQVYDSHGEGDTYRFGRGDGHDTIIEDSWLAAETDRIELKAGVGPDDVRLERIRTVVKGWQVREDLRLTILDSGETLTVKDHFNQSNRHAVEEIVFADGTLWDLEEIRSQVLLGHDGNDTLRGFNGRDDVLVGGKGNDELEGGSGSDTYRYALGDGQDMIVEGNRPGQDVLEMGAGISANDVTVRWTQQGDMAVILADGDRITIRGQASNQSVQLGIELLRFADGTTWDRNDLAARALLTTDGDDTVVGSYGDDSLDGGAGNDHFQNLGGYDTWRFGIGDGQDVIESNRGRVLFKAGIGQNDVTFSRDGSDLIATVVASGDALRLKDWLNSWQRIDAFDFANGARLNVNDVRDLLNVSDNTEILYGSPGEETLVGTEKNSILYGREGDDLLIGGAGQDSLYGEDGNDTLDGGTDRDWLYGGAGNNTYLVAKGMDLDTAMGSSLSVANDTVVFAPGIRPEDISVQLGETTGGWNAQSGDVGYYGLVIGIGGNDALVVRSDDWNDLGRAAIQHFRFADGTEWTLAEVIARADGGKMGWQQRYMGDSAAIVGSEADDEIYDYTGESVTVRARGNNDSIYLSAGNDIVSAGAGNDWVSAGQGDDLIAGEAGNDHINAGDGDDVIVFNYGDGQDRLRAGNGIDTLSFGEDITLAMLAVVLNRDGQVELLINGGTGGRITLEGTHFDNLPGDLERIQFIDSAGKARVFDWAGWLRTNAVTLLSATVDAPLAFDSAGFELTGKVAPAGGMEAVAYAQSGSLFDQAHLADNTPTDSDDVLYGTADGDTLDAGAGNDIVLGLAGNDSILGGDGNDLLSGGDGDDVLDGGNGDDVIYGGRGADTLSGGPGRDELYGEWGGDTYLYRSGDGVVIIDDDHRVLSWGDDGGEGGYGGEWGSGEGGYGGEWDGGEDGGEVLSRASDPGYGGGWEGGEESWGYGGSIVDNEPNILSFGPGISADDLRYSHENGDLIIEFAGRPGDRVILRGYQQNRATQTRSVDIIRFADGTEIIADSIEPTGRTEIAGNEGGWLYGSQFADTLIGGDGDDVLVGQGGADSLVGGAGSDTYIIHKEWGSRPTETLIGETWRSQDTNRIELTGEINADTLRLEFDGRDLLLRLTDEGDAIRFAGFDPRAAGMQAPINEIILPWWGVSLSFDDLLARGLRIIGTPENDVLTGTALADWIEGRGADDTMSGAAGGDLYLIDADGGTDTIIDSEDGEAPNTLVLPEGTTLGDIGLSFDTEGFLLIDLHNTGNRIRLSGFDPQNPLGPRAVERFRFGLEGDEISYEELLSLGFDIVGTEESDLLKGTILADRVWGDDGNDLIEATPGGDWLMGEGGNDTYVVKLGDGTVTIDDLVEENSGNVLRFGEGINPAELRNNLRFEADGSGGYVLLIPYGNDDDVVRLTGFDPQDVLGTHAVEYFEFADGTVVDYATLVSWTFVVEGDNSGNSLIGTNVGDRLYGYDGDDLLESGDGDDVLTGGAGNDLLRGGAGRDAYVVNLGDGIDVIEDALDDGIGNILTFGTGIARADVQIEVDGDDLIIKYSTSGDAVRVSNYAPNSSNGGTVIDTLEFADGTAVALREFMNRAPLLTNSVDNQVVQEDSTFSLRLPDDLFTDADGDDILTRVAVSGYERLPQWLQYDAATRTLFGTPDNNEVGEFDVIVQGMDTLGAATLHSFHVTVQNTNDAPEVSAPLANLRAVQNNPFSFTLANDSFHDADVGDVLTYSAALENGDPLPAWLAFDTQTATFAGTPANGDVGELRVRVTVTDLAGESVSQTFALEVADINDAPEAGSPLVAKAATQDIAFVFALPVGAFVDPDVGDRLSYSATLINGDPLPTWLSFNAESGTFSGTPGNADVEELQIRVTATDLTGANAMQTLSLTVVNVNDTPQVIIALPDQQAEEGKPFAFSIHQDAFRDVDVGDSLSYQAVLADGSALPSWLVFDASTLRFSGAPGAAAVGSIEVRVVATDSSGASVSDDFKIVVSGSTFVEPGLTLIGDWRDNRLIGGGGNDIAYGNGGSDYINLFGGNNTAYGSYGNDTILTGSGNDTIYGNGGNDLINAGDGQNRVYAGWGDDIITTGSSDDVIEAGGGNNLVSSGSGNDRITTLWGNDRIDAGSGNNVISAGEGNNYIVAGAGNDSITTASGNDIIHAGDGDNVISAGEGNNQIFTGAGRDVIRAFGVNLIRSGDGNDDITLGWGADNIDAGAGDDVILAGGGGDTVRGGSGNDLIVSNQWSNDTYLFRRHDGHDTIMDDGGTDVLVFEDVNFNELLFQRVGDDLRINVVGQEDRVTVQGWYSKPFGKIEQIKTADGKVVLDSQVDALVTAMAAYPNTTSSAKQSENESAGKAAGVVHNSRTANSNNGSDSSLGTQDRKQDSDPLGRFLDGFKRDDKSAQSPYSVLPALDSRWLDQWGEQQQVPGQVGRGLSRHDLERHWTELTNALSRLDAERRSAPAWSNINQGADITGLAGSMQGGANGSRGGIDAVSLSYGTGTHLKGFSGIKEGMDKLSW